jgi:hypothetical protein
MSLIFDLSEPANTPDTDKLKSSKTVTLSWWEQEAPMGCTH